MTTIHVHLYDRLPRWRGTYSAKLRSGKSVTFTAEVEARDPYEAGDKLKAMARRRYGEELYYPSIKFGNVPKLGVGSISQLVASGAGGEEDSKRGN